MLKLIGQNSKTASQRIPLATTKDADSHFTCILLKWSAAIASDCIETGYEPPICTFHQETRSGRVRGIG